MAAPIIRFDVPQGDRVLACTLERPIAPLGQDSMKLLDCMTGEKVLVALDKGDEETPVPAGDLLWNKLRTHGTVSTVLDNMLLDGGSPLYVRLGSPSTEQFPWEVLRSPGGFLALDQWPIARMTLDAVTGDAPFDFEPPVRMLVILAAAGIGAAPEWAAVRAAVATSPIPVELQVLVAEEALLEQLRADIGAENVEYTTDRRFMESKAKEFRPHLLHVFCHGRAPRAGGLPSIEIADFGSFDGNAPERLIILEPRDLLAWFGTTCITTMCACKTGDAAVGANSFAFTLSGSGVPAVIAMRQPVASKDAHTFTRAHYTSLLASMSTALVGDPLDLAISTIEARGAMCDTYGAPRSDIAIKHHQWTLPVLYLRGERLRFELPPGVRPDATINPALSKTDVARLRAQLGTLRAGRRRLLPDLPADRLQQIDEQIKVVCRELYALGDTD